MRIFFSSNRTSTYMAMYLDIYKSFTISTHHLSALIHEEDEVVVAVVVLHNRSYHQRQERKWPHHVKLRMIFHQRLIATISLFDITNQFNGPYTIVRHVILTSLLRLHTSTYISRRIFILSCKLTFELVHIGGIVIS